MNRAIGIDIGTSKICLLVFDLDSFTVIACESVDNTATIELLPKSHHEQDPIKIWELVISLFDRVKEQTDFVSLIAITGQMHGVMIIDGDNKPITNFITWRDNRYPVASSSEADALSNGCSMHVGYGANTVLGLLKESKITSKGCRVISIATFIMGMLCDSYCIDETFAASFGVYDIINRRWNQSQMTNLGLPPDLFGEVVPSGTPMGFILPSFAKRFGIPDRVQVCSPVGDNQASIIGSIGFSRLGVLNIGTSGQFSIPTKTFNYSAAIEVRPFPGFGYLQVYSSLCGGWAYAYLKDFCKNLLAQFGFQLTDKQIFDRLDILAQENMNCDTLEVNTLFLGTREDPEKRGSIQNIDTNNLSIANFAYGFIQGILKELHHPSILLNDVPFMVASGNAVRKSPLMKQAIEKEFGLPCKIPPFLEEATIGAILLGFSYGNGNETVNAFFENFYNERQPVCKP